MISTATLFEQRPHQWGHRGDPFLWQEMQNSLKEIPLPSTPEALSLLVKNTFESLTEKPWDTPTPFKIERLSHGGLTSGGISPKFWRESALPFLLKNHTQIRPASTD